MLTMQEALLALTRYWIDRGCMVVQPFNTEVGAGTLNPATMLRVQGPEPWHVSYVEPSVRPDDSRYGENPNRLQTHTQFQVILKPDPGDPQELYLGSLAALGVDVRAHDVRFVEDNWASPATGAWGLGWEVWLDGLEITQFTYFQQAGGPTLDPVSVEITYGVERIMMALQNVRHFRDIAYAPGLSYGEVFGQAEYELSRYYLDDADVDATKRLFEEYAAEARRMLDVRLPVPAHYQVLKCSHAFNVLDARGAVSTTERARAFGRMRALSREVAQLWRERRAELGHPLGEYHAPPAARLPVEFPLVDHESTLLFEIGTEELPPAEVTRTADRVRQAVTEKPAATRLGHGEVRTYATPRRVVTIVEAVQPREPDAERTVRGPRVSAASDADGNPTKAGAGFAAGQRIEISALPTLPFFSQDESSALALRRSNESSALTSSHNTESSALTSTHSTESSAHGLPHGSGARALTHGSEGSAPAVPPGAEITALDLPRRAESGARVLADGIESGASAVSSGVESSAVDLPHRAESGARALADGPESSALSPVHRTESGAHGLPRYTESGALVRVDVQGVEHLAVVRTDPGRGAAEVLSGVLAQVVSELRADKNMRWADPVLSFTRPVRWLLALLDDVEVPVAVSTLASGRTTRVHRTAPSPTVFVPTARDYPAFLAQHGIVLDAAERRTRIGSAATELAASVGGTVDVVGESSLVDEITNLVESPTPILGSFDERYLELPAEILTTVMRKHQRYLPVRDTRGMLMPYFLTVANGSVDPDVVRAGNEDVLRARYEDAAFFWRADLRTTPEAMKAGLSRLAFEERLGSMADRANRIAGIATRLADMVSLTDTDRETLARAANLAKFDLGSQMVIELTSLAGTMAREYALRAGEPPAVAMALYDMELPRTAGDRLPASVPGALLALADRLDLLAGLFAVGATPPAVQTRSAYDEPHSGR